MPAEIKGTWSNKGWKVDTAKDVAVAATAAYVEAQKFVGFPAERLIKVPGDPNATDEWNAVYTKLGKPAVATEYDLANVKRTDGSALDQAMTDFIREQAFAFNVPKGRVSEFAANYTKFMDGQAAASASEAAAKLQEERGKLEANWGNQMEANRFLAQRGAANLGLTPEQAQALEGQLGYAGVMEAMRKVGVMTGEARYVSPGGAGGNTNVMTRDGAVARKAELKSDKAFVDRFLGGDKAAAAEMRALDMLITGAQR